MMNYQPLVYAPGLTDPRAEKYHHTWFLCDPDRRVLPAARLGALQDVEASIYLGSLRLKAPGMLALELLLDVIEDDDSVRCVARAGDQDILAIDEGRLAHTWFSQLLGRDCLCLKLDPDAEQSIDWP